MSFPTFLPYFLPSFFLLPSLVLHAVSGPLSPCAIFLYFIQCCLPTIYSFQKSYLGFIFMDTAAFFVLSFFSHTMQLVFKFYMLPTVIMFLFINQPDTLIIQIYSVIKLYMFQASSLPIIRSFLLYFRHW